VPTGNLHLLGQRDPEACSAGRDHYPPAADNEAKGEAGGYEQRGDDYRSIGFLSRRLKACTNEAERGGALARGLT
jgi:hypothetical protein